jgi:hypothetical protein
MYKSTSYHFKAFSTAIAGMQLRGCCAELISSVIFFVWAAAPARYLAFCFIDVLSTYKLRIQHAVMPTYSNTFPCFLLIAATAEAAGWR